MWEKFNILSYKIPSYYNTGFTIDIKNNWIINTEKNYTIKIPFNINTSNEIYYFELLSKNNILVVTLIINIGLINNLININTLIPYKNNLFKILKNSYNNDQIIHTFKNYSNISNIINNKYTNLSKTIIIGNLYFNLLSEQIYSKREDLLVKNRCNIYFLYGKYLNFNINKHKICIIDDNYKLIDKFIINKANYKNINKEFFSNKVINISKDFFFSKEYIKEYKKFHNNYRSEYAFTNFRKYIEMQKSIYPVYNIELFSDYIIIIKDLDLQNNAIIKSFLNHPILYSQNYTFVINSKINIDLINNSEKILKKTSKNYQLNFKNIINNHLYLDSYKYLVYNKYKKKIKENFYKYIYSSLKTNISLFENARKEICPINKTIINHSTYAKLDCKCNNLFCYDKLWIYLNKNMICPYCSNKIKSVSTFISNKNILSNLFGYNLNKYIQNDTNIIYLFKKINPFNTFLQNLKKNNGILKFFQIYNIEETPIEEINLNTLLILENTVTLYDTLNSFNNKEVRNINNIIKFSLSI